MEDDDKRLEDEEWGNPPSPDTPENREKAFKAQLAIGFFALIGILLPGLLLWIKNG